MFKTLFTAFKHLSTGIIFGACRLAPSGFRNSARTRQRSSSSQREAGAHSGGWIVKTSILVGALLSLCAHLTPHQGFDLYRSLVVCFPWSTLCNAGRRVSSERFSMCPCQVILYAVSTSTIPLNVMTNTGTRLIQKMHSNNLLESRARSPASSGRLNWQNC